MKPFNEYCEEVGLNDVKIVDKQKKYRAYKNGECKVFDSKQEAQNFSTLIEEFISNEEEYTAYIKKYKNLFDLARENWYKDLRKTHSDISDELFSICYEYCLAKYSFYEIEDNLYNVVELAKTILSMNKNK
jgi:hypothetical protein